MSFTPLNLCEAKLIGLMMKARISVLACAFAIAMLTGIRLSLATTGLAQDWQIGLQEPASPIMESMHNFNTLLLVIIIPIVILVFGLLLWVIVRYRESANPVPSKLSHNTAIEVIWTIVPVLILVVIAIPSFRLLFRQFDFPKPDVVVKATGKQWYWSYEYPADKIAFDSYPVADKDLKPGQLRNLSVDNEVVVPVNKVVQVLITGADVIHQWVVPAFGSRADAIPGRINRTWFLVREPGIYYGQCSALCGEGHAYMPIVVKAVSEADYRNWVGSKQRTATSSASSLANAPLDGRAER
jgi:cytochrome c oxidase subunit II